LNDDRYLSRGARILGSQNICEIGGLYLVSCRRNNMPFVAIKMGRRQGARREHI
jgi:hypothetical protein